jgi:hypothetical protein
MAVGLIINELTNQRALVFKDHFALAHSLVIEELSLIKVPIFKVVSPSAVPLAALEVTFVIFSI